MVDDNFVEKVKEHDEVGLWGFDSNFFDTDKEGAGREGLSDYPYLLISMKL